jgi:hypothetical protein
MKPSLRSITMCAAVILLSAIPSLAQAPQRMVLDAPFDFELQGAVMPAGQYSLVTSNGLLTLKNVAEPKHTVMTIVRTDLYQTPRETSAEFNKVGSHHYLRQIYTGATETAWIIPASAAERESTPGVTVARVVLKLKYNTGGGQ